jgi:hypothetical protein
MREELKVDFDKAFNVQHKGPRPAAMTGKIRHAAPSGGQEPMIDIARAADNDTQVKPIELLPGLWAKVVRLAAQGGWEFPDSSRPELVWRQESRRFIEAVKDGINRGLIALSWDERHQLARLLSLCEDGHGLAVERHFPR